jgi:hypothetical protein
MDRDPPHRGFSGGDELETSMGNALFCRIDNKVQISIFGYFTASGNKDHLVFSASAWAPVRGNFP